ncbi:MAG: glycosyl transferase family protein [Paraglaciecola sp.]|uniref:glycosyl transferase family protein n=2 Tax=Paraglaciecola sp. TaxID=1920173 RepID=UPI00329A6BA9
MSWVDIVANYLFALRYIAVVLMVLMLISAVDDVIIDIYYWSRKAWRAIFIYRKRPIFDEKYLLKAKEKPLAIMVPAWQEVGVVARMAEFTAAELDYENYQIFVGTYPNDLATQDDVDLVCKQYPNVHKVVCARPGPTSKADCLNNVIASILTFEEKTKVKFDGFIIHDAEDVVSAMELRLFNHLLENKDLIQLPVYPFSRGPLHFTAGHYLDEFSEMHGKDIIVRESFVGQVPSAGVGTCFSRRAIIKLTEEGDGLPFDIQSLTEDYDISFRMKAWGMEEIFVRFSVTDKKYARYAEKSISRNKRDGNVVCVREYFPKTLSTSVRQKSRWIVGIVFQGTLVHKWSKDWKLNYFLWRDRKGVIAHFLSFLATLISLQAIVIWLFEHMTQDGYRFMSIFMNDELTVLLIQINFCFFVNRIIQRIIFVRRYYGMLEALVSPFRLVWGNLINFLANCRAIKQVIAQGGNPSRVAWDNTDHEYPTVSERVYTQSLGSILKSKHQVTEQQITMALEKRLPDEKLGQSLIRLHIIDMDTLGEALAEQASKKYQRITPFEISSDIIKLVPKEIVLKYRFIPLREDNGRLIITGENRLSPVALASIERQLDKKVEYQLCQLGACTVGIRYHYLGDAESNPTAKIKQKVAAGTLASDLQQVILDQYYNSQIMFGDALQQAGFIEPAVFNQIILGFDYSSHLRLGDYLVNQQVISEQVVKNIIELQKSRQQNIDSIISHYENLQGERE